LYFQCLLQHVDQGRLLVPAERRLGYTELKTLATVSNTQIPPFSPETFSTRRITPASTINKKDNGETHCAPERVEQV
jgi:hypothetical protein